ncbi:MAG TPA: C39 family peptidase [Terriglobia bacterium]|nr:C39 family peptidase [Terriglobia bacterium]
MRCVERPGARLITALLAVVMSGAMAAGAGLWLDVPFVRQQTNGCGAACISMVMQYWFKDSAAAPAAEVGRIQQALYRKEAKGIYASDMERYFRQHGFSSFAFRGTPEDLQHHLAKGRPLIVCLQDSGKSGPLHYVVVVGLDSQDRVILVNDPAQRKLLKMDLRNFETRWRPMHNWTLLALPEPAH